MMTTTTTMMVTTTKTPMMMVMMVLMMVPIIITTITTTKNNSSSRDNFEVKSIDNNLQGKNPSFCFAVYLRLDLFPICKLIWGRIDKFKESHKTQFNHISEKGQLSYQF